MEINCKRNKITGFKKEQIEVHIDNLVLFGTLGGNMQEETKEDMGVFNILLFYSIWFQLFYLSK